MPRTITESEADFQSWVNDLLALRGWRKVYEDVPLTKCWHCGTYPPQRKVRGHPDIEIVRDNRLIYLELKSQKGRIRLEQRETIDALKKVRSVSANIMRPDDRDVIEGLLR